jgi:chromosome segregation ATPase
MNTDTPRTDKFTSTWDFHDEPFEAAEHARTLERELTAAREEIDMLKSKYADHHAEAERLTSEINAVTEQRDGLRSGIDYASDQLHTVTEQRDELLRYNEAFRKETLICADCDAIRKEEYDQAIEQRDRLAEALRQMWPFIEEDDYPNCNTPAFNAAILKYKEALQSLTPNEL